MASRRHGIRRPLAAAVVLATAGCAGIPTGGSVHLGRAVPAVGGVDQGVVRIVPHAPVSGMRPIDVARGFLRAMVDSSGGYAIARTWLTPRAAAGWQPTGVTTYDDADVHVQVDDGTGATRTVELSMPRVGYVDARGDFTPAVGRVHVTLTLVKRQGEWRIDRLPKGVLVSALDFLRTNRLENVYYLNHAGTAVVPEQVLLPPGGLTTSLVRTLLAGPGPWIAPAVRTAFPTGTDLVGNVPVDGAGTAEVNLSSAVRQASPQQLRALSAQLVWTLRQVAGINAVRLLADGSPVDVPGAPQSQPRDAWPEFDPAAPPEVSSAVYDAGNRIGVVGSPVHGLGAVGPLLSPVLSHDGRLVAGLRPARRGVRLVVGRLGSVPATRLSAATLTPPTFDPAGDVFTVATGRAGRRLLEVTAGGDVRSVDADASLLRLPVQQLRVSRDGCRVAALVGRFGAARLFVGRVVVTSAGFRFEGMRPVLFGVTDVRGLSWSGAGQLVVTARDPSGRREVVAVDPDGYDGYSPQPVDLGPVRGEPTDVAALGSSLVVVAAGRIWQHTAAGWRYVGVGATPAYPD